MDIFTQANPRWQVVRARPRNARTHPLDRQVAASQPARSVNWPPRDEPPKRREEPFGTGEQRLGPTQSHWETWGPQPHLLRNQLPPDQWEPLLLPGRLHEPPQHLQWAQPRLSGDIPPPKPIQRTGWGGQPEQASLDNQSRGATRLHGSQRRVGSRTRPGLETSNAHRMWGDADHKTPTPSSPTSVMEVSADGTMEEHGGLRMRKCEGAGRRIAEGRGGTKVGGRRWWIRCGPRLTWRMSSLGR